MFYGEKCFASGRQSLNSEHVRQNINYIGTSGFFREASMETNRHAFAVDEVTSYFCTQWK